MKNIFLIGMPSSGKSTLGRSLAKALDYHFFDMDKVIEELEQMTIVEIFEEKGEDYFRKLERKVLKTLPPNNRLVVSTGGGVPCFFENMTLIKDRGMSIFLDVKPEIIAERIVNSKKQDRPHYNTNDPQLLKNLKEKYQQRLPFYTQADHHIKGDNISLEALLVVTPKKSDA